MDLRGGLGDNSKLLSDESKVGLQRMSVSKCFERVDPDIVRTCPSIGGVANARHQEANLLSGILLGHDDGGSWSVLLRLQPC